MGMRDFKKLLAINSDLIGENIIVTTLNGNSVKGKLISINLNSIVVKIDLMNFIIANVTIDSISQINEGPK